MTRVHERKVIDHDLHSRSLYPPEVRKVIKRRASFPADAAVTKLFYLA